MYPQMAPPNPRKRAAPGAGPTMQQQQLQQQSQLQGQPQTFMPTSQTWIPESSNSTSLYTDPNSYNLSNFGNNQSVATTQFQPVLPPSTQLARRPAQNRQALVRAGPGYSDGEWPTFSDEAMLSQQGDGALEETDNVDVLEERAIIAKRDATSKRKQIPPFVQKLSSFLDDGKNTDLIRWSDRGDSFIVLDEDEFAKTLIPELFKHNNYASFVRQLNMYGFHKRVGLSDNSMKASERKNKSPSEYSNPYFRRGHPNLLWLINKPKGGTSQKKTTKRGKTEEGEDDDDDGNDGVEAVYSNEYSHNPMQHTRAISAVPESGPLQKREMALVQNQLQDIQKQQAAISNAISRLRKDHNQLYQQAVAFQTLHDRHENSINAILTFLATIYNRSLDDQGGPNISQMFANIIPQSHQQGNVVDMSDIAQQQQQQQAGNMSPHRRPQRLLMAPPTNASSKSPSPAIDNSRYNRGSVEELFDSTETPHIKAEGTPIGEASQQDILNMINTTNASSSTTNANFNFPDVLNHYENANGGAPLTASQRNDILSRIANQTSAPGLNNALISPSPPPRPDLTRYAETSRELDDLARMQRAQDERLRNVNSIVQPLSPSGSIPGLDMDLDNYTGAPSYFGGANNGTSTGGANLPSPGAGASLDLNDFLAQDAFTDYNNGSAEGISNGIGTDGLGDGGNYYDAFNNGVDVDPNNFDFGISSADDGTGINASYDQDNDNLFGDGGRIVEEASTPGSRDSVEIKPDPEIEQREDGSARKRRKN